MESKPEMETTSAQEPVPAQMNFAQRVAGVYFEPAKTFEDINRRPTWLGMFLLLSIIMMGATYTLNIRMDRETRLRKQFEMSPIKLSEEQIQQAVSRPPTVMENIGFVFVPIAILVTYYILAAIYLLAFVLMGASIPYKKALATSYWAMGPPGIVLALISIALMWVRDPSTLELDVTKNVASNLGMLVAQKEHAVLYGLLSSIDIFSIWTITLLSIGYAAVSNRKFTAKKAATVVITIWCIWIVLKLGYYAVFG